MGEIGRREREKGKGGERGRKGKGDNGWYYQLLLTVCVHRLVLIFQSLQT